MSEFAPNLDIHALAGNANHKVSIGAPDGSFIFGFNQSEIVLGGSNEFNSQFDLSAQGGVSDAINMGITTANNLVGTEMSHMRLVNKDQTLRSWSNSTIEGFVVDLVFVSTSRNKNIMNYVNTMLKGVKPSGDTVLTAPYGYKGLVDNPAGTWSLQFGNWLSAYGLVLDSVSMPVSSQAMVDGRPLYVTISAQFSFYRIVTLEDDLLHILV